jgi:uncharacterized protein YyaL (SSP411 family)
VVLPTADDAAAWFVATARAAVLSGERVDAQAVRLLMALAPGDPAIAVAIDRLASERQREDESERQAEGEPLAAYAREATLRLREAAAAGDEAAARETVTALETEVLRAYRPSRGLDRFEDDVAVALAMIAAYDIGADEAHLMMAEELMLGVLRREWARRAQHGLAANCEAAVALAALAARTDKVEYRERALEVMRGYAATYREHGVRAAAYVSALRMIS